MAALRAWREAALPDGPPRSGETVFLGIALWGQAVAATRVNPGSIIEVFRRLGRLAGLPEATVARIGGHSPRVGCAQDLREQGFGLLEVMQAGRWKQPEMAQRYTEKVATEELAIRRLAEAPHRA